MTGVDHGWITNDARHRDDCLIKQPKWMATQPKTDRGLITDLREVTGPESAGPVGKERGQMPRGSRVQEDSTVMARVTEINGIVTGNGSCQ